MRRPILYEIAGYLKVILTFVDKFEISTIHNMAMHDNASVSLTTMIQIRYR
jgi:hypothetical protein